MAAHPRSDGRWTHRRRVLALIASGHDGEVRHMSMLAVWYDRQGRAADVLRIGQLSTPEPGPGDVRIRSLVRPSWYTGCSAGSAQWLRSSHAAGVVELTGLLRTSHGGDELANWPPDMRIICRRERPSAGAQLCALEPGPIPGRRRADRRAHDRDRHPK